MLQTKRLSLAWRRDLDLIISTYTTSSDAAESEMVKGDPCVRTKPKSCDRVRPKDLESAGRLSRPTQQVFGVWSLYSAWRSVALERSLLRESACEVRPCSRTTTTTLTGGEYPFCAVLGPPLRAQLSVPLTAPLRRDMAYRTGTPWHRTVR